MARWNLLLVQQRNLSNDSGFCLLWGILGKWGIALSLNRFIACTASALSCGAFLQNFVVSHILHISLVSFEMEASSIFLSSSSADEISPINFLLLRDNHPTERGGGRDGGRQRARERDREWKEPLTQLWSCDVKRHYSNCKTSLVYQVKMLLEMCARLARHLLNKLFSVQGFTIPVFHHTFKY